MNRSRPGSASGFSLLEMLVAVAILALAMGIFYRALGGSVRSVAEASLHTRALIIAESLLQSRDSVDAGGWNESGAWEALRWSVASAPFSGAEGSGPALHRIRVEVTWLETGRDRRVELVTLLPERIAKQ